MYKIIMSEIKSSLTKRFGILTAGGDCPGLNAAIRSVCHTAYNSYGMEIIGIAEGFRGLIEEKHRFLEPSDFSGILTRGGTILGTSREKPFNAKFAEANEIAEEKVIAIKETYKKLKMDCLVALGGNGTNTTCSRLARQGINIISLPKTIDNDIVGTDLSIGFSSALATGTEAIDRLHSTAQSHSRIIVIELMGHRAGWLALYAGVAGGGDIILIPEIPYDIKAIVRHLEKRAKLGKAFSVVVAAEGALSIKESSMEKNERKKYQLEKGPSAAYRIASEIYEETGMETRATVLGYVQRGGIPSPSDRVLATRLGKAAADLLAKGEYGCMTALAGNEITSVELSVPEGKTKTVPTDHFMIGTASAVGTCLGI